MSLTVHLSGHLKAFTGGVVEVHLPGEFATLGDALDSLWQRHGALRERVLNEQGEIRQHVNVFVGNDNIKRLNGIATPIRSNEVHIFNAVSGG